jgi:hypothetical protein
LAASKASTQKFDGESFNLCTLSELEVMKQYQIEMSKSFAALQNLGYGEDINRAWENIKDNIRTSTKGFYVCINCSSIKYGLMKKVHDFYMKGSRLKCNDYRI